MIVKTVAAVGAAFVLSACDRIDPGRVCASDEALAAVKRISFRGPLPKRLDESVIFSQITLSEYDKATHERTCRASYNVSVPGYEGSGDILYSVEESRGDSRYVYGIYNSNPTGGVLGTLRHALFLANETLNGRQW